MLQERPVWQPGCGLGVPAEAHLWRERLVTLCAVQVIRRACLAPTAPPPPKTGAGADVHMAFTIKVTAASGTMFPQAITSCRLVGRSHPRCVHLLSTSPPSPHCSYTRFAAHRAKYRVSGFAVGHR